VVMAKAIGDIVGAMDPQEAYENSNNEVCGNVYRRLVTPDPADANKIIGDLAEKWTISEDSLTFTFELRRGVLFDSGKPVTAEDAAFSLQRAVKLNKAPAFILQQFDFTADNVDKLIRATGDYTLQMTLPAVQAPSFVLYCLAACIGGVVEKATALANQTNGDFGNAWLRTHSAGAGPYRLVEWVASDRIVLETNPHAAVKPHVPRIVQRHTAEPSSQLLLVSKGDADIARDLSADELTQIYKSPAFSFARTEQLMSMYLGLNMNLPQFQKPQVLQAIKWAIDYDAIAKNITPIVWSVWQTFLPKGSPGSIADKPFQKNVAKAKALLAAGGYADGFSVTLDHVANSPYSDIAQAVQADLGAIGVKVQLLPGEQNQVITKMRARQHQMTMMTWFPDYLDPNSNSQAFNSNADNSDNAKVKLPAWRCHFVDKALTDAVEKASKELDAKKRNAMYGQMQRDALQRSPFVFLLQQAEIATMRKGVSGITIGLRPDYTRYIQITKT
jgi:peptide/nickel transport system substrate-binding protein